MPVIVIGADTALGAAVLDALLPRESEVRAFISDPELIAPLKARGVKVAVGDVSDGSHVGGACLNTFCAVLVPQAASDDRERSFAATPDAVVAAWAEGLADGGVTRAIWIEDGSTHEGADRIRKVVSEFAAVEVGGREPRDVAAEVAAIEAASSI